MLWPTETPRALALAALVLGVGPTAVAADAPGSRPSLAQQADDYCKAMARPLSGAAPGAVFLASYELDAIEAARHPALVDVAYVYDNALAAIAFVACGRLAEARRLADALSDAVAHDRFYKDGRVRNGYRAGRLGVGPPVIVGWWDAASRRWFEDAHQVGTHTGNAAWAALALLTTWKATGVPGYHEAAAALMSWVATLDCKGGKADAAGLPGGFDGHEPAPLRIGWKSTEHNIDAYAAFTWLAATEPNSPTGSQHSAIWQRCASSTGAFVAAMFDEEAGRFLLGTQPDGLTPRRSGSGLDTQLWPILAFSHFPQKWRRALTWAEEKHGVDGGFDFNDDRDGVWVEGTCQAALVYRALGDSKRTEELLNEAAKERAADGLLFATRGESLTTGLSVGPGSTSEDFKYLRLPHLGATAWAVLAATGWNPFMGTRIPEQR